MKINLDYLKHIINLDVDVESFKELLNSIGIEVDDVSDYKGSPVLEVEITPNRPDWLSHYGIAREIKAKKNELKISSPSFYSLESVTGNESFSINIENFGECGRYTGCIVRNIQVGESSQEVKDLLDSFGLRPINNIVDISNLVVMTLGQPIHIFDLDKLQGNEINIRRGKDGEKLTLLDEQEVKLSSEHLVIADRQNPVALAGVMGGLDSGVTLETKNIFIESAYFNPSLVRKTARSFGLSTDASYRFERGGDILVTRKALEYALNLIDGCCPDSLNITYINDYFPVSHTSQIVELDKEYTNIYSGIQIEEKVSARILENLGFQLEDKGKSWSVGVPSYRVDIYGKQDLVEEITRIYGYDKLESKIPFVSNLTRSKNTMRDIAGQIRNYLTALGYNEVINYSFHSLEENKITANDQQFIEIKNPLGLDFSVMRNSLVPGLLRNTELNLNNSIERVTLFEIGKVFSFENDGVVEKDVLGVSASGKHIKENWNNKKAEYFDLYIFKSYLIGLLNKFCRDFHYIESQHIHLEQGTSFTIIIDGKNAGYLGELNKESAKKQKLNQPVFLAELDLAIIIDNLKENRFRMWNKFPSSRRDFSFLIGKSVNYLNLESEIEKLKPETLENYSLVDKYEGKNIPNDKVSLSMSFSYRSKEKTLTNEEVNDIHNELIKRLVKELNLIQR